MVCAGDILAVTTDRKWLSFMRSYPNFIPLSAREVEHIGAAMQPFPFDVLYGHYFDRVIAKDAKQVLEKSVARYVGGGRGDEGVLTAHAILDETPALQIVQFLLFASRWQVARFIGARSIAAICRDFCVLPVPFAKGRRRGESGQGYSAKCQTRDMRRPFGTMTFTLLPSRPCRRAA